MAGKQLSTRLKNLSVMIGAATSLWVGTPLQAQSPKPIPNFVAPLDTSFLHEILQANPDDVPILVKHRQDPNAVRPNESLQAAPRPLNTGNDVGRGPFVSPQRNDLAARRGRQRIVASNQNRAAAMIGDMFGGGSTELSATRILGEVIPYANPPERGTNFNGFVGFDAAGTAHGPFYAGMTDSTNHFPLLSSIGVDTNNDKLQDTFPNLLQYHFANGVADPNAIEDRGPFEAVINSGKTIVTPGGDTVPVLQLEQKIFNADVPSPSQGGGVVGRVKIGENTSPMPRDRVFFNYSYFNGVPLAPGGVNVNRFTPGFEKTLFDGLSSIEFRAPFATTLSTDIMANGLTDGSNLEFGNLSFAYKQLLYHDDDLLISGGSQLQLPTADAVNVNLADGTTIVRVKNQAVHLMPFVGALYTPNERLFSQGFIQLDFGANRDRVLTNLDMTKLTRVGTIGDAPFIYLDWSTGYWIYLADNPNAFLTGIAPIGELHLNQSLQSSDVLQAPGNFQIGTRNSNISVLNAVVGTTFQFGPSSSLTAAYCTPLGGGSDQQFNGEFRLTFNRRFGPQTIQTRAF
ncbi:MAG: hypothetical protein JWM11_2964 [Planctomycetaceae bacterium]|nr:hypothetical protein [Planctomycetaceae bacterium]